MIERAWEQKMEALTATDIGEAWITLVVPHDLAPEEGSPSPALRTRERDRYGVARQGPEGTLGRSEAKIEPGARMAGIRRP